MSKQDRQGVRTASDLERKYDFGNTLTELESTILQHGAQIESHSSKLNAVDNSVDSMGNNLSSLTRSINTLRTSLSMLQGKLDTLDKAITRMGDSFSTGELNVEGNATIGAVTVGDVEAQNIKVNGDLITAKPVAPRNLLDNSDFTNPVNQRGQTNYTGADAYTIDRWKLYYNLNLTVNSGYITIAPSGVGYNMNQFVGDADSLGGKTLTYAVKGSGEFTIVIGYNKDGTSYYPTSCSHAGDTADVVCCTATLPVGVSWVGVYIQSASTTDINLYWAALYEGSYTAETLPPYVPKGYSAELLECQRYYLKLADGRANDYAIVENVGGWGLIFNINTPVPMRTTPSIVLNSNTSAQLHVGSSWYDVTASLSYGIGQGYICGVTLPSGVSVALGESRLVRNIIGLSADL